MEKMKVLFIVGSIDPAAGSTKSLTILIEGLKAKGFEIGLVFPKKGSLTSKLEEMGYKIFIIPFYMNIYPPFNSLKNSFLFPLRLIHYLNINRKAQNILKEKCNEFKPDVIHSNVGVLSIGEKTARSLGIPHVYHIREYQTLDFNMKWIPNFQSFLKTINRRNNFNICITKGLQDFFKLNAENSCVIYNGLFEKGLNLKPLLNKNEKKNYFLYVGRIEEAKGIKECIDAFSRIVSKYNDKFELWIAGKASIDNYQHEIENYVKELNIANRINFLGIRKDIDDLMRNSLAYIMSSRFEAFGRTTAEAMIYGTLVIGKNTGGTKEQFDNGLKLQNSEIGLRYTNPTNLAKRLEEIIRMNNDEYFSYLQQARETVIKLYPNERNIEEVYNVYCNLIHKNENGK